MSKKSIDPVYRKCKCGRRIIHHHILCDKCWRRKQKMKINRLQTTKDEDTLKLEEASQIGIVGS